MTVLPEWMVGGLTVADYLMLSEDICRQIEVVDGCLLVVEVMSPNSITTDRADKPTEYAQARMEHFWRLEFSADECGLTLFRYRLDPITGGYALAGEHTGKLIVSDPFEVALNLDELM